MSERIPTELSPPPVASSVHRPWSGVTVQLHDWQTGGSVVSPVVDHDIIAMRVTGSVRLTQYRAGKIHRAHAIPGNVTIHARGFESRWSWDRPGAIVLVRASQNVLAEAAVVAIRRAGEIELQNCFGARDAFIEHILNLFALELRRSPHPVQELIAGCLSAALAVHLVQRFNAHQAARVPEPGALEPHALRRALDYVHSSEHTSGKAPLTLTTLAEIAGVSRFHFARRFRRSTGQGLVEYVRRLGRYGAKQRPPTVRRAQPRSAESPSGGNLRFATRDGAGVGAGLRDRRGRRQRYRATRFRRGRWGATLPRGAPTSFT